MPCCALGYKHTLTDRQCATVLVQWWHWRRRMRRLAADASRQLPRPPPPQQTKTSMQLPAMERARQGRTSRWQQQRQQAAMHRLQQHGWTSAQSCCKRSFARGGGRCCMLTLSWAGEGRCSTACEWCSVAGAITDGGRTYPSPQVGTKPASRPHRSCLRRQTWRWYVPCLA